MLTWRMDGLFLFHWEYHMQLSLASFAGRLERIPCREPRVHIRLERIPCLAPCVLIRLERIPCREPRVHTSRAHPPIDEEQFHLLCRLLQVTL